MQPRLHHPSLLVANHLNPSKKVQLWQAGQGHQWGVQFVVQKRERNDPKPLLLKIQPGASFRRRPIYEDYSSRIEALMENAQ